jgi:hypothetical protein
MLADRDREEVAVVLDAYRRELEAVIMRLVEMALRALEKEDRS